MNKAHLKKIKKEVTKAKTEVAKNLIHSLCMLPLRHRMRVCYKILFAKVKISQ